MKRVLENNGKERAEKFKYLEQGLKLCELCALDKSVEVHLLQDIEAGELLAPLVFVQSCQHPESGFLMIIQNLVLLSMDRVFFKAKVSRQPWSSLSSTCFWAVPRQQVSCKWWHSSRQSTARSRGWRSCNSAHCTSKGHILKVINPL